MYVDHKLWIKGYSSVDMDLYYCIEGLLESTKSAIILIVCPTVDDKTNILWISSVVTFCIRNVMMTSVRIGGYDNNLYLLTLPVENIVQTVEMKLTDDDCSSREAIKSKKRTYAHFYMNGPFNYRDERQYLYDVCLKLNCSQWVESADSQLLETLSKEDIVHEDYMSVVQCGYESLVLINSKNDDEGSNKRTKNTSKRELMQEKCNHRFSYSITEILTIYPINWDKPFDTAIKYSIRRQRRQKFEVCLLCSFRKYLNRSLQFEDVVKISSPLCYLLANN